MSEIKFSVRAPGVILIKDLSKPTDKPLGQFIGTLVRARGLDTSEKKMWVHLTHPELVRKGHQEIIRGTYEECKAEVQRVYA